MGAKDSRLLERSIANIFQEEKERSNTRTITWELINKATEEKDKAVIALHHAKENLEYKALVATTDALELKIAQSMKEKEEIRYEEAQMKVKAAISDVEEAGKHLSNTKIMARSIRKDASAKLQAATKKAARIEQVMTQNIVNAQVSKFDAEGKAIELDEKLMQAEVESTVTQKFADVSKAVEKEVMN